MRYLDNLCSYQRDILVDAVNEVLGRSGDDRVCNTGLDEFTDEELCECAIDGAHNAKQCHLPKRTFRLERIAETLSGDE